MNARNGNGNGDHPIEGAEKAWLRDVLRRTDVGVEKDELTRLRNVLEEVNIGDVDRARILEIGEAYRQRQRQGGGLLENLRAQMREIGISGIWEGRVYFEKSKKSFWIPEGKVKDEEGQLTPLNKVSSWVPVNENTVKRLLIDLGLSNQKGMDAQSEVEKALLTIPTEHAIDFAGPRAGYMAGQVLNHNGEKSLVTSSPTLIEPKEGDCSTITRMIDGLFGENKIYFLAWMKDSVVSLRSGARPTGKALVMAGPRDCGKSFVQDHIISPLLGRVTDPYLHMSGGSNFNASLASSEHGKIEDQSHSDSASRRDLASSIKQATAAQGILYHPKGKDERYIQAFRRLSISTNEEAKYLAVLPTMDDSLEDKILILRTKRGGIPEDHGDPEIQKAYAAKIKGELPAFLHHLLTLEIDPKYKGRFGVAGYKDPEILRMMEALEPWSQILEIIDVAFEGDECVEGTATKILGILMCDLAVSRQCQAIVHGSTKALGQHLASLVDKFPDRFKARKLNGRTLYTITGFPPRKEAKTKEPDVHDLARVAAEGAYKRVIRDSLRKIEVGAVAAGYDAAKAAAGKVYQADAA